MSADSKPRARSAKAEVMAMRPRPLFAGDWRVLSGPQREAAEPGFVDTLQSLSAEGITLKAGEMRVCKTPFYVDADLWEIDVYAGAAFMGVLDVLMHNNQLVRLNGTSPPLHEINAKHGVLLDTSQRAGHYITFFCNAVHGEHGSFAIFSGWSQIPLSSGEHNDVIDALSKAFPRWLEIDLSPVENQAPSIWQGSTCLCYSGHIFRANMVLEASGMVRMTDDKPLSEGLPILSTVYRNGLRRLK